MSGAHTLPPRASALQLALGDVFCISISIRARAGAARRVIIFFHGFLLSTAFHRDLMMGITLSIIAPTQTILNRYSEASKSIML